MMIWGLALNFIGTVAEPMVEGGMVPRMGAARSGVSPAAAGRMAREALNDRQARPHEIGAPRWHPARRGLHAAMPARTRSARASHASLDSLGLHPSNRYQPTKAYAGDIAQSDCERALEPMEKKNPTWSFVCLPETVSPYGGLR